MRSGNLKKLCGRRPAARTPPSTGQRTCRSNIGPWGPPRPVFVVPSPFVGPVAGRPGTIPRHDHRHQNPPRSGFLQSVHGRPERGSGRSNVIHEDQGRSARHASAPPQDGARCRVDPLGAGPAGLRCAPSVPEHPGRDGPSQGIPEPPGDHPRVIDAPSGSPRARPGHRDDDRTAAGRRGSGREDLVAQLLPEPPPHIRPPPRPLHEANPFAQRRFVGPEDDYFIADGTASRAARTRAVVPAPPPEEPGPPAPATPGSGLGRPPSPRRPGDARRIAGTAKPGVDDRAQDDRNRSAKGRVVRVGASR
jgi:hypothetical protein